VRSGPPTSIGPSQHEWPVKWFNNSNGYGFIGGEDGPDVFVDYTAIAADDDRTLREGERVSFDIVPG
jgi:CspA family cold shock protein